MPTDIFARAENILYTTCLAQHDPADYWRLLSISEQQRARQRVNKSLQDQVVLSYGLRRSKLAALLNEDPRQLTFDYVANKKPILLHTPLHFNIAHSEDYWALLVNKHHAVGVDVESTNRKLDFLSIAQRFFSANEVSWMHNTADQKTAFWQLWTAKEALLKSSGIGLNGLETCLLNVTEKGHLCASSSHFQAWKIMHLFFGHDGLIAAALPLKQTLLHCVF